MRIVDTKTSLQECKTLGKLNSHEETMDEFQKNRLKNTLTYFVLKVFLLI